MQCKVSMDLQFCMSEEHFSLDILVLKLDRYQTQTNELEKLLVEAGGGLRAGQHRLMRRRTGTRRRLRAVCRAAAAVPVARRPRPLPCDTPIAKEYFELCGRIIGICAPSLPFTKAANYSSGHEDGLEKFLSDSRLNIDNNLAENVVRPWCIGRKNWLFVGNEIAGRNAAILESFAATCKECNVDFETWPLDAIYEIDRAAVATLPELMPHVWEKTAQRRRITPDLISRDKTTCTRAPEMAMAG